MAVRRTVLPVLMVAWAQVGLAWEPAAPGSWVGLEVEVGGRTAPLYTSADGSRHYVEARKGRDYALRLRNRTGERVAVELNVDGLNVISGERDKPGADRMYVLGPYESTEIRGWRTSLEEVRRFTFVDEEASYSSRSGKANGKMGWIEMAVYRERYRRRAEVGRSRPFGGGAPGAREEEDRAAAPAPSESSGPQAGAAAPRSYPGTGWGERMEDRVSLVEFEEEAAPVETFTVRYEYRSALYALGVLPRPSRSRLEQRERGEYGFAQPPRF